MTRAAMKPLDARRTGSPRGRKGDTCRARGAILLVAGAGAGDGGMGKRRS